MPLTMKTTITKDGPQRRTNITISPRLYAWAKAECELRGQDFSGYLADLIYDAQKNAERAVAEARVIPRASINRSSRRRKGT